MRVPFLLCPPIRLVLSLAEVMTGKFCKRFGAVAGCGGLPPSTSPLSLRVTSGVVGVNEIDPKRVVVVGGVTGDDVARRSDSTADAVVGLDLKTRSLRLPY